LIDDSESRLAHEANAPIAAVSIGETRADSILSLKINARCGEVRASYFEFELLSDTAYDSLWFSFAFAATPSSDIAQNTADGKLGSTEPKLRALLSKMSKPYSQATIVAHNHNLWRAHLAVKKARPNM
jgi:hypothetical protein